MAKAGDIADIEPGTTFQEAAALAVEARTAELFGHAGNVLDTEDIERVHDMRVATRRLRAVMEVFAPCFPEREYAGALRQVKALADALGERRDPDVMIEGLEGARDDLGEWDRPGLDGLVAELRTRQSGANDRLALALGEVERSGLKLRLLALAAAARRGTER